MQASVSGLGSRQPCPAGTVTYDEDSRQLACGAVVRGSISDGKGGEATKCLFGTFSSGGICSDCPVGTYSHIMANGDPQCTNCPLEFYNDKLGASKCAQCLISTPLTDGTGLKSLNDCSKTATTRGRALESLIDYSDPK